MYRSRIYKKNGSLMEVELNARTSQYNNEPAAFTIVRDITDRLKVEEELRIAKAKLETLNQNLETRIKESSQKLTEANTQLIRLQKENLQSQFEVLRQQVNPHFLFNSLNVLTSLIKLEPDLAEKFTEHLSKVYRYVLENKDNNLVDLKTELDFLDAYIFLLNIRFMDKIEVNVSIDDDKKELKILPLALQLLIENAIKHNSMSKKNPLKIDISVENENTLTVENNLQERESHMASTGVGLKNINHRYSLLEMPAPQFYKTETKFIARIPLSN
jgi:LytS/YehU family sensor histidine kinase